MPDLPGLSAYLEVLRVLLAPEPPYRDLVEDEFNEQFPHEKGFAAYYRNELRRLIEEQEQQRITRLKKIRRSFRRVLPFAAAWVLLWVGIHIAGAMGVSPFNTVSQTLGLFFTLIIVTFGLVPAAIVFIPALEFVDAVKGDLYPHVVRFFGPDWTYQYFSKMSYRPNRVKGPHKKRLTTESMQRSLIAPEFTAFDMEDYLTADLDGRTRELGEITLVFSTGSDSDRSLTIRFKGLAGVLPLASPVKGRTVVRVGSARKSDSTDKNELTQLAQVDLNHPEFHELAEVYSSDPSEALGLFDSAYRSAIVEFADYLHTHELSRGFRMELTKSMLLVLIPETNRTFFQSGTVYEPAVGVDDLRRVLLDANVLQAMKKLLPDERSKL